MFNQPNLGGLKPKAPEPNPFDASSAELKKALDNAKNILILIRENPKLDHVAAALSLYLTFKNSATVTIACPTDMRVEFNRLVAVNKITSKIGNRNLVVSFPYVKDSIEKVSYNVDDANFNLVIQPKTGFPSLESDKVKYSYSGVEANLVFTIGCQKLEDLGIFYQSERQLFQNATLVNIDTSFTNTKFATINLTGSQFSSTSEIVYELNERLSLKIEPDTATNLLAGMSDATQNFQRFNLKPQAFEIASKLMAAGGKRPLAPATPNPTPSMPNQAPMGPTQPQPAPFRQPQFTPPQPATPFPSAPTPAAPVPFPSPQAAPSSNPQPLMPPASPPPAKVAPTSSPSSFASQPPQPIPPAPQPPKPVTPLPSPQTAEPPLDMMPPSQPQSIPNQQPLAPQTQKVNEDWLKPKIYKGSTKV